ncbi:MAG: hypothetical protein V1491_02935 [archaeon]
MRNKTHLEQIERWGNFVKENPDNWKGNTRYSLMLKLEIRGVFIIS